MQSEFISVTSLNEASQCICTARSSGQLPIIASIELRHQVAYAAAARSHKTHFSAWVAASCAVPACNVIVGLTWRVRRFIRSVPFLPPSLAQAWCCCSGIQCQ